MEAELVTQTQPGTIALPAFLAVICYVLGVSWSQNGCGTPRPLACSPSIKEDMAKGPGKGHNGS